MFDGGVWRAFLDYDGLSVPHNFAFQINVFRLV